MATTNEPWFCYTNHSVTMVLISGKTVDIQMAINMPKKYCYYTFMIIKPWFKGSKNSYILKFFYYLNYFF